MSMEKKKAADKANSLDVKMTLLDSAQRWEWKIPLEESYAPNLVSEEKS